MGRRFCLLGRVRGRLGGSARQRRGKGLRDGWGNGGRAGKIRRQCDRRRLRDCWAGERCRGGRERPAVDAPVSYTHLRAHETPEHLVCRLLLEKKKHNPKRHIRY